MTLKFPAEFTPGATTVVGDTAIFAGGYVVNRAADYKELNTVRFYDSDKRKWSSSQLPRARDRMGATTIGDQAFFAGGFVDNYQVVTDAVDIYNVHTHHWSATKLSVPRAYVGATSVGRLALFAGGVRALFPNGSRLNNRSPSDIVDMYDSKTGRWTTAHLSSPRTCVATTVGKYALFDGPAAFLYDFEVRPTEGVVDIYNAKTNVWSTAHVPQGAIASASVGHFALFLELSGDVDTFDADTGGWSTTHTDNFLGTIATAGNDVLFPGSGKINVFNSQTARWSTVETPIVDRDYSSAFTIGDTAYFGGGFNHKGEEVFQTRAIEAYTLE